MNPKKPRRPCAAGCGQRGKTPVAKYCSLKCQRTYQRGQRLDLFLRGEYPSSATTARFIRRYLIETLGERCVRCHWAERNPVTNRVPLELEHIDGDWRNNRPENVTLLCPNCHSLTPTFKALNRGNGREAVRWFWRNRIRRDQAPDARPARSRSCADAAVAASCATSDLSQLKLFSCLLHRQFGRRGTVNVPKNSTRRRDYGPDDRNLVAPALVA